MVADYAPDFTRLGFSISFLLVLVLRRRHDVVMGKTSEKAMRFIPP